MQQCFGTGWYYTVTNADVAVDISRELNRSYWFLNLCFKGELLLSRLDEDLENKNIVVCTRARSYSNWSDSLEIRRTAVIIAFSAEGGTQ